MNSPYIKQRHRKKQHGQIDPASMSLHNTMNTSSTSVIDPIIYTARQIGIYLKVLSALITIVIFPSFCFSTHAFIASISADSPLSILNLGDSYTAGPGLYPIIDAACGRSGINYAHQIATRLSAQLTDISCTGATTQDFSTPQRDDSGKIENPAQFTTLTHPYNTILVSIGGNDLGIIDFINQCATPARALPACLRIASQFQEQFTMVEHRLHTVYHNIRVREPHALLIGVGYGQPISRHSCTEAPLSPRILRIFSEVIDRLNELVKKSVLDVNGTYINTSEYTYNHNVCSPQPWYSGVIAPAPGQGIIGHPRKAWMNHMASIILPLIIHREHI